MVQREEDGGGGKELHKGIEERVEGEGAAPREHARGWVAPVQEGGGGAWGGGGGAGEGDLRGDGGVVEGVEEEGRGADGAKEEEAAAEDGGERELGEAEHAEAVLEEEARGEDVAVGVGRDHFIVVVVVVVVVCEHNEQRDRNVKGWSGLWTGRLDSDSNRFL